MMHHDNNRTTPILVMSGTIWGVICGILAVSASELARYFFIIFPEPRGNVYDIAIVCVIFIIAASIFIFALMKTLLRKKMNKNIYIDDDQRFKISYISIAVIILGFLASYVAINEVFGIVMVDNSYLAIPLISFFLYKLLLLPRIFSLYENTDDPQT